MQLLAILWAGLPIKKACEGKLQETVLCVLFGSGIYDTLNNGLGGIKWID